MEELVDGEEMAKILRIPVSSVHYYARQKGLPVTRVGKHKRFNPSEVLTWIKKNNTVYGRS